MAVSADIQASPREMAQTAGAGGFVEKPFDARRLVEAVGNVLRGGQSWN